MKKTVIKFGLIAGAIIAIMMVVSTMLCYNKEHFEPSMVVGYAGMLVAFSFVFVGIKNYRDKHSNGYISLWQALKIGLLISLVASSIYVIVWLIEYYFFIPDFMEKYAAMILRKANEDGLSAAEIASKTKEMEMYKDYYKSPFWVIVMTFCEVFPIGIVVSLISALVLKKKAA